jgi:hypothetical protein
MGQYWGGWLTELIMQRVNSKNNCLIIIEGETGSGKSCLALNLAQHYDPYFSSRRIAFTPLEFMDLLNEVPAKGWIVWDESGVNLSHRDWQSANNKAIMMVIQSFRYKFINVIFCLPSAQYMDKVPREMCHFLLRMQRRGAASVYRIRKTAFSGDSYVQTLGTIAAQLPTKQLMDEFYRMHAEHQEQLYADSRREMEAAETRLKDRIDKALTPVVSQETLLDRARLILPRVVNVAKDTDQGLIDVSKIKEILKLPHSQAYSLRKPLLDILHDDNNKMLNELRREANRGQ